MVAVILVFAYASLISAVASPHEDKCAGEEVSCTASRRVGAAFIQTRTEGFRGGQRGAPSIALTTRMSSMEASVTELESLSKQGREDIKTQVEALKASLAATKSGGSGSLDDTISRVTAAEGSATTLEDTANAGNQEIRAEIEILRTRYETLTKRVGQQFSSLLQADAASASAEDPAAAAPAALAAAATTAAGGSLLARCEALETRVAALEADSGAERDGINADLEALGNDMEATRAGGVQSLEHTTGRQTSAETQVSSLQDTHERETADMRTELEALQEKLATMGKNLGADSGNLGSSSLLQAWESADPAAAAAGGSPAVPLTTRMDALQQRIDQLTAKSGKGRGELRQTLTALTVKLESMKAGDMTSLEHTTLRVGSTEKDLTTLAETVVQAKAGLLATVEAAKAKTTSLEQLVGIA